MIFKDCKFIKPDIEFQTGFSKSNYAPLFRKRFTIRDLGVSKLYVCGLGYGYYYLNGERITEDLFIAPVSNYNKTLWYNVYDVSKYLRQGENILAVQCGNGWYNEDCPTRWKFHEATWRDLPKFILKLVIDGKIILKSDETWKCMENSAVWFNNLRSGEYFDVRKYDKNWKNLDYDDSQWRYATLDYNSPKGKFRECFCEPIREDMVMEPIQIWKTGEKKYLVDFGQNISGYIRIKVKETWGQEVVIRYAEQINSDYSIQLNKMDTYYPESEFQTDKIICSGQEFIWSPQFCYHGFRYVELEGMEVVGNGDCLAVFVHQAVSKITKFKCSNEFLNKLFVAGQFSTLSNMFYLLSDCPTREKMGWLNDAQASAEQLLVNFDSEQFLKKWLIDIHDAMREDGCLPGIAPTAGSNYTWGNGPVSDGAMFEIPYRIYLNKGNKKVLIESIPYFEKYFAYVEKNKTPDGMFSHGLFDWAYPGFLDEQEAAVPVEFINAILLRHFYEITALAYRLDKNYERAFLYEERVREEKNRVIHKYILEDGTCKIEKQTAIAMMIYHDVYDDIKSLKNQLKRLIEKNGFHHDCGMVGLRRLFHALSKCGLQEYAYKIITSKGYPSYSDWFERNGTTMWEYWDYEAMCDSKNHHMYSDVMSWMIKNILGLNVRWNNSDKEEIIIKPFFFSDLEYAEGSYETKNGQLSIKWNRIKDMVCVLVEIPEGISVFYNDRKLHTGLNKIVEREEV